MTLQTNPWAAPRALVIDDSPLARFLAARILTRMGYKVSAAPDGLAGVSSAQLISFDLILMDVEMPIMNGLECTRQIRHLEKVTRRHATIIGVSATQSEPMCLVSGMDAFLPKPLNGAKLESTLTGVYSGGLA